MHNRNIPFDLLRALAIFLVLGMHFNGFYVASLPGESGVKSFFHLFGHGYYGVTVFFVLSGYLITWTQVKRQEGNVTLHAAGFYVRRATRILPLVYLTLAAGYGFLQWGQADAPAFKSIFKQDGVAFNAGFWASISLFFFNWHRIALQGAQGWGMHWDVLWSLAVEEQFYLLFPLVVIGLGTVRRLRVFLLCCVACGIMVRGVLIMQGEEWRAVFINSFSCIDALSLGVLAALMPAPRRNGYFLPSALLLIIACGMRYDAWMGMGSTLVALATAGMIMACRGKEAPYALRWKWLARPGMLSFGMYLWHPAVLFLLAPVLPHLPPLTGFIIFFILVTGLAELSFRWYERPVESGLRKRFLSVSIAYPS